MVKITGPLASHHASGRISAPRVYSSSLRNREDRQAPPAPPPPSGGSLLFTSSSDNCNAPSINHSNQYPGTLETWSYLNTAVGFHAGTFFGTDVAGASIDLDATNINALVAFNNKFYIRSQSNTLSTGMWNHLALTWDSGLMTIWENGVKGNESGGFTWSLSHHSGFHVGGQLDSTYLRLDGYITRIRFSDVIRYTTDFTPAKDFTPDANTISLWRMTEGVGTTVADESGNGHTLDFPAANLPTWSDKTPN